VNRLFSDRQPSLDGLRGIAVTLVFFYHHNLLNIGWAGVELFFVLSGFLITAILRQTRDDGHFWKEFWIKRATRIVPPLIPLLLVVILFDHTVVAWIPAYLLSLGDLIAYIRPKYQVTRPLWSLAVEEHFYLLWPFAVRFLKRCWLLVILVLIIVAEPTLRGFVVTRVPDWELVYFLTPFRLDGISLGCLLALATESSSARKLLARFSGPCLVLAAAVFAGLRLLLGLRFSRGNGSFYNAAAYSLIALLAFFLIANLLTRTGSIAARVLAWRPLVFLGTISYGLYLYQNMCRDLIMRIPGIPSHDVAWLSAPLTVLTAWLSFAFYEKPLILWGKGKARNYRTLILGPTEVSPAAAP